MTSRHSHRVALRGYVRSGSSRQCQVTGNFNNHECSQSTACLQQGQDGEIGRVSEHGLRKPSMAVQGWDESSWGVLSLVLCHFALGLKAVNGK